MAIQILDCLRNLIRSALTLDPRRPHNHVQVGKAIEEHAQDIAQSGAAERSYDSYCSRQKGEGAFAARLEKAFFAQAFFELLEGDLQRADSARLHLLGIELKGAASLIDIDPPAHHYLISRGGFEAKAAL